MTSTMNYASDIKGVEATNSLVDVMNPYNPKRNTAELQHFLMVCMLVAGKTAYIQNKKFIAFKAEFNNFGIFDAIYFSGIDFAMQMARKHGLGKYTLFEKFIKEFYILNLDLKSCTAEELEKLPGIGFKSSRFLLINCRENYRCAVLDTWILKFLKTKFNNIPSSTPTSKFQYSRIENLYLDYCDNNNLNPRILDLELWKQSSRKENKL